MTLLEAKDIIDNHRIRSPRKLRAAARVLMEFDLVKYEDAIRSLIARAKDAESKKEKVEC